MYAVLLCFLCCSFVCVCVVTFVVVLECGYVVCWGFYVFDVVGALIVLFVVCGLI